MRHSGLKCECGNTALYRVGFKGFCRQHYTEGVKAQAKLLHDQKVWAIVNKYKKN